MTRFRYVVLRPSSCWRFSSLSTLPYTVQLATSTASTGPPRDFTATASELVSQRFQPSRMELLVIISSLLTFFVRQLSQLVTSLGFRCFPFSLRACAGHSHGNERPEQRSQIGCTSLHLTWVSSRMIVWTHGVSHLCFSTTETSRARAFGSASAMCFEIYTGHDENETGE